MRQHVLVMLLIHYYIMMSLSLSSTTLVWFCVCPQLRRIFGKYARRYTRKSKCERQEFVVHTSWDFNKQGTDDQLRGRT